MSATAAWHKEQKHNPCGLVVLFSQGQSFAGRKVCICMDNGTCVVDRGRTLSGAMAISIGRRSTATLLTD